MKYLLIAASTFVLMACASEPATETVSEPASKDPIPVVKADQVLRVQATVVAVDTSERVLTLQDQNARVVELQVSDDVKNFDKIQKGDFVEADYYEAIAVFVQGANGEAPAVSDDLTLGKSKPEALPGGLIAETQVLTADVVDIDYDARTVVLKGPDGINRKFPVSDRMQNFDQVKKGDQVVVKHTMALAIGVREPAMKQ